VAALGLLLVVGGAHAADARVGAVRFVPYASGLSSPVFVTSAPGRPGTLYVVERAGTIKVVRRGQLVGTFLDIRSLVMSGGELGLLSMAFNPRYRANHLFYVSYTDRQGNSRVVRYRSARGRGVRSSGRILLTVHQPFGSRPPFGNHKGGQLEFDRRGYLYIGFGDGGSEGDPNQTSQNPKLRLGKLLRSATTTPDRRWEMIALGLRNPWRFSFDSHNNLWIADVGQDHWEEVDFRPALKLDQLANYGWSRYEGNAVYNASHTYTDIGEKVSPVLVYPHTDGRCAITGGYVHRGRYYYGDYCSGGIWSFPVGEHGRAGPPRPAGNVPSISSFGTDGAGHLFAVSLDGSISELR
jgi:glucose/arabinose dehydrogenase